MEDEPPGCQRYWLGMAYSYEEMDKLQACLRCGSLVEEYQGLNKGPALT